VFVVYDNFRIIMRWNASVNYALAVGLLSDAIASKPVPKFERRPGWETEKTLSSAQVKRAQEALRKLGLFSARATGLVGRTTMAAVKQYQEMLIAGDRKVSTDGVPILKYKSGRTIIPDGHPSLDLYEILVN
jgi:membrane-bound lytic murein transglycosylase B